MNPPAARVCLKLSLSLSPSLSPSLSGLSLSYQRGSSNLLIAHPGFRLALIHSGDLFALWPLRRSFTPRRSVPLLPCAEARSASVWGQACRPPSKPKAPTALHAPTVPPFFIFHRQRLRNFLTIWDQLIPQQRSRCNQRTSMAFLASAAGPARTKSRRLSTRSPPPPPSPRPDAPAAP